MKKVRNITKSILFLLLTFSSIQVFATTPRPTTPCSIDKVLKDAKNGQKSPEDVGKIVTASIQKCPTLNEALRIFKQLIDAKIEGLPNVINFSTLINFAIKTGNLKSAIELFHQMTTVPSAGGFGLRPDVVTFTTLIDAAIKTGNLKSAIELFQLMTDDQPTGFGLTPNVVTLNVLISAEIRRGGIAGAKNYVLDAINRGFFNPTILSVPELDFHCDKFYTPQTFHAEIKAKRIDPEHVKAVPLEVAIATLYLRMANPRHVPFPYMIVVGYKGGDIIAKGVKKFLNDNGYTWELDSQNKGRIHVTGRVP